MTVDPKAIEAATPIFKELNLTQDQAQKLVEMTARREHGIQQGLRDAYTKTIDDWTNEAKAFYGTKLPEVRADIGKLLESVPEDIRAPFREAMDVTGAGNHPAFIKVFHHIAKAAAEGKYVTPGSPVAPASGRPRTHAEAIYGTSPAAPQSG